MITLGYQQICEYCLTKACGEPCRFCGFDKTKFKKELGVLPPGSTLMGKYIAGKVIGKGGFGITYLAYDTEHDKKVALKEYFPSTFAARDEDGRTVAVLRSEDTPIYKNGMEKFYEEASLVSKFNGNPNIVSVHEFFYENGTAYFVMELLRGCSLKAYIAEHGCLSPDQALYIADGVSNALVAAHSTNTLHRDISPDNIMICRDGSVKLIDFGAARQVALSDPKSMSIILKQGFAPLEQYQKHGKQGPWTDLYSLGATLYYSVTGKRIDDPMTRMDNDENFQSNQYDVEPQLWELIRHSLNLNINDRYKDAFEFREALGKIAYKPQDIKIEIHMPESAAPDIVPTAAAADVSPSVQPVQTASAEHIKTSYEQTTDTPPFAAAGKKPQNKKLTAILGGAAGIALVIGITLAVSSAMISKESFSSADDQPVQLMPEQVSQAAEPSQTTQSIQPSTTTPPPEPTEVVTIKGRTYSIDVTELDLSGRDLTDSDIEDLKYFKNLNTLDISDNNITDLSVLSSLTNIKYLYFGRNNVSSLEFASGMKELQEIQFYENNISDLSPLSGTTKIVYIHADYNPIKSLDPLKNNVNMAYFSVTGLPIRDISALSGMKKLKGIDAANCGLTDISALSGCADLTEIYLNNNQIYDLSPLHDCSAIEYLELRNNSVSSQKELDTFTLSLRRLQMAEGAKLDIRDSNWNYTSYGAAYSCMFEILVNSYMNDFEFYANWLDENGEPVSGLVK